MQKVMKKMWHRKKGFTLVELLIVVAIIGILVGIAIPNFLGARIRARVAKSYADLDAIAKANEMYFVDNGEYTDTTSQLAPTYVASGTMTDPWGDPYKIYTSPSTSPTMYLIVGYGPDQNNDVTSGDISWAEADRVRGAIGGPEGADSGYGINKYNGTTGDWYNPAQGVDSQGDLGYGSG